MGCQSTPRHLKNATEHQPGLLSSQGASRLGEVSLIVTLAVDNVENFGR
jgi:hypothetical protein